MELAQNESGTIHELNLPLFPGLDGHHIRGSCGRVYRRGHRGMAAHLDET